MKNVDWYHMFENSLIWILIDLRHICPKSDNIRTLVATTDNNRFGAIDVVFEILLYLY